MVDRTFENQYRIKWVSGGVADLAAPTVAEVDGGEDLTPDLPTGGVAIEGTENNASLAMIDKGFVSESVGTEGATMALTFKRDDTEADDPAFIFTKGDSGTIIVIPFGGAGYTATAGDKVETYSVEAHTPTPTPPAENTKQQVRVTFAVSDRNLDATVAA